MILYYQRASRKLYRTFSDASGIYLGKCRMPHSRYIGEFLSRFGRLFSFNSFVYFIANENPTFWLVPTVKTDPKLTIVIRRVLAWGISRESGKVVNRLFRNSLRFFNEKRKEIFVSKKGDQTEL